jgi:hypothetical protein
MIVLISVSFSYVPARVNVGPKSLRLIWTNRDVVLRLNRDLIVILVFAIHIVSMAYSL